MMVRFGRRTPHRRIWGDAACGRVFYGGYQVLCQSSSMNASNCGMKFNQGTKKRILYSVYLGGGRTAGQRSRRHDWKGTACPCCVEKSDEEVSTLGGMADRKRTIWILPSTKDILTSVLESGVSVPLLLPTSEYTGADSKVAALKGPECADGVEDSSAEDWASLGRFTAYILDSVKGSILMESDKGQVEVGAYRKLECGLDVKEAEQLAEQGLGLVVTEASDWTVIPAENLIAAFQDSNTKLLPIVGSVEEAELMFDVMECGTDGVVLKPASVVDGRKMAEWVKDLGAEKINRIDYETATVVSVQNVGVGDRVCVDLVCNMVEGEGMLCGSFARGLFLVHSECEETSYINSRPFRVNAGPVHSYIQVSGNNRTKYLSEISTGDEILVYNPQGVARPVTVGRVKIEKRPLLMVVALGDRSGISHSIMLQNAETVKLVGPGDLNGDNTRLWSSISVTKITKGSKIFIREQVNSAARHTGILIDETIYEK